jgi:leucyl aminopeptidase
MDFISKRITQPETQRSQCLILPVFQSDKGEAKLSTVANTVNRASKGLLQTVLKRGDIKGKVGEALLIPCIEPIKAERILLIGCGDGKKLSEEDFRKVINTSLQQLRSLSIKDACLFIDQLSVTSRDSNWQAEQIALLHELAHYRYQKTLSKPVPAFSLKRLTLASKPSKAIKQALAQGKAIAKGMNNAKELGNLPGNICTPSYLAKQAKALARGNSKLSASILEEKKMRELGMGSLLSVTAGTDQPAKLIVMNYKGGTKKDQPHVLVGKGITFDSGGISLKPGAKMDEMKFDMCGAASVFGTMTAITQLQLPINVVAIVAAAENMPSSGATKPGDVVTSMSGQTIEVLNTDAEGRLVLCDALTYAERFKPKSVIDVATLTGACVVALGRHATGLYSNQDDFAAELLNAGKQIGDRAWQMPLWDDYQPQLNSNFADIANIGGPEAGSVTAACFLSRFAKKFRWAHLDIAGTAWLSGANKGATGRPVGLLTQYLINQCA